MVKVGDRVEVVKIVPAISEYAANSLERRWKGKAGTVIGEVLAPAGAGFSVQLDCEGVAFGFYEEELIVIA